MYLKHVVLVSICEKLVLLIVYYQFLTCFRIHTVFTHLIIVLNVSTNLRPIPVQIRFKSLLILCYIDVRT